jgi:tRNA-dihydrouridine synthase A
MMDVTDRHCRYFLRQVSRHALLYTEMITTAALIHGDVDRHLRFDPTEQPVALQLGGSEPADLAHCARLAERYGYDEINLNVGCPSERVQKGAFGACLMAEPALVAECVRAMRAVTRVPVTVKHRIGIDRDENYDFMCAFVETVAAAGCDTFIVHARNAILKGLSPKQNREIPPLRYDFVHRLKREHPALTIVINGGIATWAQIEEQLAHVDGVMIGRAAYNDPWLLAKADQRVFGDDRATPTRVEVTAAVSRYAETEVKGGVPLRHVARHLHGLYRGEPVAKRWRRMLSDACALNPPDAAPLAKAAAAIARCEFVGADEIEGPGSD